MDRALAQAPLRRELSVRLVTQTERHEEHEEDEGHEESAEHEGHDVWDVVKSPGEFLVRDVRSDDTAEWRRLRHALWPATTERDHIADWSEYTSEPASHVIAEAEAWARARGCTQLASDSEADNVTSIAAHRVLGFAACRPTVNVRKSL